MNWLKFVLPAYVEFLSGTNKGHGKMKSLKPILRKWIKAFNIWTRVCIVCRLGLCLHIVFVVENREQCSSCTGRTSLLAAATAPPLFIFVCLVGRCVVCFICGGWLQLQCPQGCFPRGLKEGKICKKKKKSSQANSRVTSPHVMKNIYQMPVRPIFFFKMQLNHLTSTPDSLT